MNKPLPPQPYAQPPDPKPAANYLALRTALYYTAFGLIWIIGSDTVVDYLLPAKAAQRFQTIKGAFFIILTATLLFFLVRHFVRSLQRNQQQMQERVEGIADQYQRLFQRNPSAMLIFDPATRKILAANDVALLLYGFSRDELLNMSMLDLVVAEERPRLLSLTAVYAKDTVQHVGPFQVRRRDGRIIFVEATTHQVEFDGQLVRIALVTNVTERLQSERSLTQYRNQLEQRVAERTIELSQANRRLREEITERQRIGEDLRAATITARAASEAKSKFLANTGHEIRTPLTSILGYADLLSEKYLDPIEREKYVDVIRQNARHLLALMDDLLDLSRAEMGKVRLMFADQSPRELAQQAIELLHPRAVERELALLLRIEENVPESIRTDGVRLRQILLNLLSNAIKFTEKGSVSLILRGSPPSDQTPTLRFDITDTGIGVNAADLREIFEPFYQVDHGITRRAGGFGLGLAISRQLAEQMGGQLAVESRPQAGSTFSLLLPINAILEDRTQPQPPASPAPPLVAHVLLAEDTPNIRLLVSEYLTRAGARVTTVTNGAEAVATIKESLRSDATETFDLVILDLHMPVLDGASAMAQIREAGFPGPVVGLSADHSEKSHDQWTNEGWDAMAAKPIDRQAFIPMLARRIARRSANTRP